jgi:hypothetical protein
MNVYEFGQPVCLRNTVTLDGVAVPAAALTLEVTKPDCTTDTYTLASGITAEGDGYRADIVVDQAGWWRYRWTSETPDSVDSDSFVVRNEAVCATGTIPVPWATAADMAGCLAGLDGEAVDVDLALTAATSYYDSAAGWRFGLRSRVIRPQACAAGCRCSPRTGPWFTDWATMGGVVGWSCGCSRSRLVDLGEQVNEVTEVIVDGVIIDPGDYELAGGRVLVRLDGGGFPCCQPLSTRTTEAGTAQIAAVFGSPPPPLGRLAVAELGCELAKDMAGADCALPPNTANYSRQNLTVNLTEAGEIGEGMPGLRVGNLFLQSLDHQRHPGRAVPLSRVHRSVP